MFGESSEDESRTTNTNSTRNNNHVIEVQGEEPQEEEEEEEEEEEQEGETFEEEPSDAQVVETVPENEPTLLVDPNGDAPIAPTLGVSTKEEEQDEGGSTSRTASTNPTVPPPPPVLFEQALALAQALHYYIDLGFHRVPQPVSVSGRVSTVWNQPQPEEDYQTIRRHEQIQQLLRQYPKLRDPLLVSRQDGTCCGGILTNVYMCVP